MSRRTWWYAGLADKVEIQLAYAIGVANPVSINVDTYGTGKVSEEKLVELVRNNFDLRPAGIIRMLDLRRPIYKQTAATATLVVQTSMFLGNKSTRQNC